MDWTTHHNPTGIHHVGLSEILTERVGVKHASFASPRNRSLPLDTAKDVLLSAAFYYGHCEADQLVESNIKKATEAFGLNDAVGAIVQEMQSFTDAGEDTAPPPVKSASVMYAYEDTDGSKIYPIGTPEQLMKSASMILQDLAEDAISPAQARTAAIAAFKKASVFDCVGHLPARIINLGKSLLPDWTKAHAAFQSRRGLWPEETFKQATVLFRKACSEGEVDDQLPTEFLQYLHEADTLHGVKYASAPTPEEIVFCGETHEAMHKMASSFVGLCGSVVPAGIVASITDSEWSRVLGTKDMAQASELVKKASLNALDASAFAADMEPALQQRIGAAIVDIVTSRK